MSDPRDPSYSDDAPSEACTLSILAGRPDVAFVGPMVRHVVRACAAPFAKSTLVLDALPPAPTRRRPDDADRLAELRSIAGELLEDGTITDILELTDRDAFEDAVSRRHFGKPVRDLRDHRGVPLYGWIAPLEASDAPYHVHFDSDVLLYQRPGHSWIDEGIALMQRRDDVLFVAPSPGPSRTDGTLGGQAHDFSFNEPDGFYAFKNFSSRRFLTDRRRLAQLLPVAPQYLSRKRMLLARLRGRSPVLPWEVAMSVALENSRFVRAHLASPDAWALHAPDHGPTFQLHLAELIRRVEDGEYPPEQAGFYDLDLDAWVRYLQRT